MIARITARHRECAFAGSRTRLLGILTLRPASQLEHSPTRFVSLKLAGWRFCKSPLNPTDANSHRSALWFRVDKICSHLPWPGVRTIRDPGHSGRRPPSLSASLCRAPPPLSSSSGTESLTAPRRMRPLTAFSSLFCFLSISLLFLL